MELLTREGEIEIAKRIEDGLRHMIQAISACPTTIARDPATSPTRSSKDEMRIDEVVDGLIDSNAAADRRSRRPSERRGRDEEEDEGDAGAHRRARTCVQLKVEALERFATIRQLYAKHAWSC